MLRLKQGAAPKIILVTDPSLAGKKGIYLYRLKAKATHTQMQKYLPMAKPYGNGTILKVNW